MENYEIEEWRPIKGYEGLYSVSNLGRIYSHKRNTTDGHIYTPKKSHNGYDEIILSKEGKIKKIRVNRIVYETFMGEIPKGMHVNHIDENKSNNCLSNLNLLTSKENANWGTRNDRIAKTRIKNGKTKTVMQYTKTMSFINKYSSISEAARQSGIGYCSIKNCCYCKSKTAGGYIWKFLSDDSTSCSAQE